MKKTFLILMSLAFATKESVAQKQMEYGLLTGVNLNTARGQNIFPKKDLGTYAGKSIGGFFKINLSKKFGIKTMLQYDQNGYKLKNISIEDPNGNTISNNGNVTIRNTYLNIPILAEYSVGEKVKVNFNAGPFIGIGLSNFIFYNIDGLSAIGEPFPKKQKSDSYKKFNLGLSLGVNVSVPINNKVDFNFGIKDNIGVTNIFKIIPFDNTLHLNAFSVLGGVSFRM
jgi:Outer membrane protein beta-barrel domain